MVPGDGLGRGSGVAILLDLVMVGTFEALSALPVGIFSRRGDHQPSGAGRVGTARGGLVMGSDADADSGVAFLLDQVMVGTSAALPARSGDGRHLRGAAGAARGDLQPPRRPPTQRAGRIGTTCEILRSAAQFRGKNTARKLG